MFLRPQFYAEDGFVWFEQGYNLGWLHSLSIPDGGYLNTIQRLAAGLALIIPFRYAPLLMNCCGLVIQALPIPALLSVRSGTWGTLKLRLGMAAIYMAVPNSAEIHVVLTNSQWHLALLMLILAFADPPVSTTGRLTDALAFAVGSVSGPFGLILLPLIAIFAWMKKQSWSLVPIALLIGGGAIQIYDMVVSPRDFLGPLKASMDVFIRILGGHIFLSGVLGWHSLLPNLPLPCLLVASLFGMSLCLWCFLKGPLPMKLLLVFAAVLLAAALKHPLIYDPVSLWHGLLLDHGSRYWFFPMLSFLWASLWCAQYSSAKTMQLLGSVVLLLLPIGIVRNWHYAPLKDHHFRLYVAQFERARPGEKISIPIYPDGTTMDLIKHDR